MIFLFCSLLCFYWVMGTLDRTVRLAVADTGQSDAAHRAALEVATTDRDSDRGSDRESDRGSDRESDRDLNRVSNIDSDRDSDNSDRDPFKDSDRGSRQRQRTGRGGARVAWANE